MSQQFDDGDRVTAFIARQLHRWATEKPRTFVETEQFLLLEKPALVENHRTAGGGGGGGGTKALRQFLESQHKAGDEKFRQVLDFLMLFGLKNPKALPDIYNTLLDEFSRIAAHEPEVWIRLATRYPFEDVHARIVKKSLPLIPSERLLVALSHERLHAQRANRKAWSTVAKQSSGSRANGLKR